jgi:syntaxin 18
LVQESYDTTENLGKGNQELKRASERKSTAQAVFWGTVGFCGFLVVWDLVF